MKRIDLKILANTPDENLLSTFPKKDYGLNRGQLRSMKRQAMENTVKSAEELLKETKEKRLLRESVSTEKQLVERIEILEKENNAILQMKNTPQEYTITGTSTAKVQSIPVIVASDWHIDELVLPEKASQLNEFNEKVAEERIQNFFKNSRKLLDIVGKDVKFDTTVLALLGDFISGNIHEELLALTWLRPIDAVIWVQQRLVGGIEYLLKNTNQKFIIVCHAGNHSRITKKISYSNEQGNSLEYYMYHMMKEYFKNEKRIEFMIANGYHTYLNVFNKTIRFHHGHAIKYGGGIGGIFIPVYKAISQWNKARQADLDVFGHKFELCPSSAMTI